MAFTTYFNRFAAVTSRVAAMPAAFILAASIVLAWALTGPVFDFSNTWQLVVNTGTTIVTFLMVFLIQNTQYRDTQALQLKMDEIIRTTSGAQNMLLDLESMDAAKLEKLRKVYEELAEKARKSSERKTRTGVVEIQVKTPDGPPSQNKN
jgi:low affinity Fe/Cu permease